MASTAGLVVDATALRREAAALAVIPHQEFDWNARLILGVGSRG